MTQEELQTKIYSLDATIERTKEGLIMYRLEEKALLGLINKHVEEVIGEDPSTKEIQDGEEYSYFKAQSELREDQRKRAGL